MIDEFKNVTFYVYSFNHEKNPTISNTIEYVRLQDLSIFRKLRRGPFIFLYDMKMLCVTGQHVSDWKRSIRQPSFIYSKKFDVKNLGSVIHVKKRSMDYS